MLRGPFEALLKLAARAVLGEQLAHGGAKSVEGAPEKMLKKLEQLKGQKGTGHRRRSGYNGAQARDHGAAEARKLLQTGLAAAGLE